METVNDEVIQALGYANNCGYLLALFFVGVAATVAAARLKKSVGLWVFAVATFIYWGLVVITMGLESAEIDFEIMRWHYVFTSTADVVLLAAMLVGVALIKPPPPETQS